MSARRLSSGLATLWTLGAACAAASAGAGQPLTYADLVARLTDPARLAVLPEPGERCAQWSSYNRDSQFDPAAGRYVNWSANKDGNGYIRQEGDAFVLAEMDGPGCIWRIWSARAEQGHVRIFLDGQARPAVDMPFGDYFDGQHPPFNYPLLSYDLQQQGSRGQNLYVPIPYQKSCKIVADKGWGAFFHFTYGTFPTGTQVPTFTPQIADCEALRQANALLTDRLESDPAGPRPGQETLTADVALPPGQSVRLAELSGARAITGIRAQGSFPDREDEMAALRQTVLRIAWDDQPRPAVWCPLGDFFGTAPGRNEFKTLLAGVTPEGFYSHWYMPFARRAVVELVNDGPLPRRFTLQLDHAPLGRPFEGLGHFHAKWHRDVQVLPEDRWPDWVLLRTQGRGRFCGVMLHVWNPLGGWWGEGDEKFFVDGEKFPSTFGTGSEDYFGYGWCNAHLFQRPFHAQTMTQNNRGHQSVLRWQVADNVPFHSGFEGCLEKYFKNEDRGCLYACVAYWYLAPGGGDPYGPVPLAERHGYYAVPELIVGGFRPLGFPQGHLQVQKMDRYGPGRWRDDDQLWWTGAKPPAKLDLKLEAPEAGRYELSVVLTKARDYAIVQFALDGRKLGAPIDLYNPTVIRTEPISLGVQTLEPGPHKLTVELVGANEKAVPSYMFGIDFIDLKRVP